MSTKKTPAKKAAAKASTKAAPASKARARGRALAEAVIAHLAGPKSPIGEPRPLNASQLARCEQAMGVALSPFMHALFAFDVGWLAREVGLFNDQDGIVVFPAIEVIRDHAGVFTEFYEPWCAARLTGHAAQLDAGSDSMRFLYLGAPDEHGEYPVLGIDHDDLPVLSVEHGGFDLWVAETLGLKVQGAKRAASEASKRILGSASAWELGPSEDLDFDSLPVLAPAPAPGTVEHVPVVMTPGTKPKQKKLTDKQLLKALSENARAGRVERLAALIAEARERGVPRKPLDEALVEACLGKHGDCMRALLDAGASANARDYYGGALARLITYGGEVELVRMLLDAGASPDSPGVNGETAIFEAVEQGEEAILRLLVERGANVNHEANNELTPLHEAVREQRDPRFVDILCQAGAKPDTGKQQSPPLVWAAEQASVDHVRSLLAHGASVDRRAAYLHQTALHAAYSFGRDDVAAVLVQAGADRALRDERGLSLERIYGPDGNDVREIAVRYVSSTEPQELHIRLEVAVTNPYQAPNAWLPALDAANWATLVAAGAGAEAAIAPEKSRADVLVSVDRDRLGKAGFHEVELALRVSGVAEGFVRWMLLTALGGTRVLTGAGAEAVLRIVSLDAKGSRPGGERIDLSGLRAWASSDGAPAVWPGPLPFALTSRPGDRAEIVVTPQDTGRDPEALLDGLYKAMQGWAALLERLPRSSTADERFSLMAAPQKPAKGAVHVKLVNVLGRKSDGEFTLPWDTEAATAQLGQVLRVVHANTPLQQVELVLPPVRG